MTPEQNLSYILSLRAALELTMAATAFAEHDGEISGAELVTLARVRDANTKLLEEVDAALGAAFAQDGPTGIA